MGIVSSDTAAQLALKIEADGERKAGKPDGEIKVEKLTPAKEFGTQ